MLVFGQKLVQRVGRVDGLELLCGVFAGILEDNFGATGVLGEEVGYVVGFERGSLLDWEMIGVGMRVGHVPGRQHQCAFSV